LTRTDHGEFDDDSTIHHPPIIYRATLESVVKNRNAALNLIVFLALMCTISSCGENRELRESFEWIEGYGSQRLSWATELFEKNVKPDSIIPPYTIEREMKVDISLKGDVRKCTLAAVTNIFTSQREYPTGDEAKAEPTIFSWQLNVVVPLADLATDEIETVLWLHSDHKTIEFFQGIEYEIRRGASEPLWAVELPTKSKRNSITEDFSISINGEPLQTLLGQDRPEKEPNEKASIQIFVGEKELAHRMAVAIGRAAALCGAEPNPF
jgi:hypothetical protein